MAEITAGCGESGIVKRWKSFEYKPNHKPVWCVDADCEERENQ